MLDLQSLLHVFGKDSYTVVTLPHHLLENKSDRACPAWGDGIIVSNTATPGGHPPGQVLLFGTDASCLSVCERLTVPGRCRQTHQVSSGQVQLAGIIGFAHTRFCLKIVDQFLNVGIFHANLDLRLL